MTSNIISGRRGKRSLLAFSLGDKLRGKVKLMEWEEIEKQRLIGKQLMIVDLIHAENDKAQKTGFSFVTTDHLQKWSGMEESEVKKLVDTCAYMDDFNLSCNAAKDLDCQKNESEGSNSYLFYLNTFRRLGSTAIIALNKEVMEDYCNHAAKINYEQYQENYPEYPVDEAMSSSEVLQMVLEHYVRWFVKYCKRALEDGYDWDVVARMARTEISEERFAILEQI